MIIHNCDQNSEEWHKLRLGKFTASEYSIFIDTQEGGRKTSSSTKETALFKKAAEIITHSKADSDIFSNVHLERGKLLESEAREEYEFLTGNTVDLVGFIELNDFVGSSPDGLIGRDGILEIKNKDNHTFLQYILNPNIEKAYSVQIQFNLYVTGRQWCDFVNYNVHYPLFIQRVQRDNNLIELIKNSLDQNVIQVKQILANYESK